MRTILFVLFLAGCTGPGDSDSESDIDTDSSVFACMDRPTFQAMHADEICSFSDTCPDGPIFESASQCRAHLRDLWENSSCWDDCLAKECAEWLATNPQCQDDTARMADACEEVYKCP